MVMPAGSYGFIVTYTFCTKSYTNGTLCGGIPCIQGRIYYEANEASASSPHHLGGPHQNFNAVSKVDFLLRKISLKVNLL